MLRNKFWNPQMIVAVAAIIVSICAMAVSYQQTRIMREQQYASVWPNVSWGISSGQYPDSTAEFQIIIVNKGIGPAIVRDVKILYEGRTYTDNNRWEAFQRMIKESTETTYASLGHDQVIQSGEEIKWCVYPRSKMAYKLVRAINQGLYIKTFDLLIEYQNVYKQTSLVRRQNETIDCDKPGCLQKAIADSLKLRSSSAP